ncbi:MAG: glycine cleavage system protein GcvH [Spirochaetales bacterium]|nr:glycine cleavage system protein GcvH [Spirochaetales bacterium]
MSTPAGRPESLRYTRTHEWVRVEGETAYVGITDYAQEALGDIVFVELPPLEESFRKEEEVGTVESVKAASPIFAPASGTIVEVNQELEGTPELLNQKPWEAFIYALRLDDPEELGGLLDAAAYERHVEEEKAAH